MHDQHEPTCAFCAYFVFPFDADSPLADWGYCKREVLEQEPTAKELKSIEAQVRKGDYSFLNNGILPLYQAQDEGCEKYKDIGHI